MSDILERLDKLKVKIQDEDFLKGNGLSNEVNIHIFCYDPADEMAVRYFTEQLVSDQDLKCHVIEKNLYRVFLQICEENDFLDAIPDAEESMEREEFLQQIAEFADSKVVAEKISDEPLSEGDVILITGVGEAYPFIRVHAVLDAIQPDITDNIPIVVMYPGSFNGRELKLFNKLKPDGYYRAFNSI